MALSRPKLPNLALPQDYSRRVTFRETLSALRQRPDELYEVVESVAKESKAYEEFRHHSPKTQGDQDRHLQLYYQWVAACNQKTLDQFAPGELDEEAFPANDNKKLFDNLGAFLIAYLRSAEPRSGLTSNPISWPHLARIRESLQFWIKHKRLQLKLPAIPPADLHAEVTEVMRRVRYAYRDSSIQTTRRKTPKPYLGHAKLRQLFECEMTNNSSIEYSEQHQAAWCIVRLTVCRVESVCLSGDSAVHTPLAWGNLEFEVDGGPGKFVLTIHFNPMRLNDAEDPADHLHGSGEAAAHVTLRPLNSTNLMFSAAHRLLVIALRRGILEGIETLDELMAWEKHYIRIKPANQSDYLFFDSNPRGNGLDTQAPLSVHALDDYLESRCREIGYTTNATGILAIRRKAAADLMTRIGPDATRRILGYTPEFFSLERYYLFIGAALDQTGALLEEEIDPSALIDTWRKVWTTLAVGKTNDIAIRRTRGAALKSVVHRLAAEDHTPPPCDTAEEHRNYCRRLRLHAHRALLEQEKQQANATVTQARTEQKQRELDASHFANTVVQRALELQAESCSSDDVEEHQSLFVPTDGDDDDDDDDSDEAELDFGDSLMAGEKITLFIEEEVSSTDTAPTEQHFATYACAFMEALLYNSTTTYQP